MIWIFVAQTKETGIIIFYCSVGCKTNLVACDGDTPCKATMWSRPVRLKNTDLENYNTIAKLLGSLIPRNRAHSMQNISNYTVANKLFRQFVWIEK